MVALVIAEHDNGSLKGATHNTVTAASQCGGEVHVLVAGSNCGAAAEAAAQIAGVSKVLVADAPHFADGLAENVAEFLLEERRVLIRPEAVDAFADDVNRLRDDVERTAKRIAKLEQKLEQRLAQRSATPVPRLPHDPQSDS